MAWGALYLLRCKTILMEQKREQNPPCNRGNGNCDRIANPRADQTPSCEASRRQPASGLCHPYQSDRSLAPLPQSRIRRLRQRLLYGIGPGSFDSDAAPARRWRLRMIAAGKALVLQLRGDRTNETAPRSRGAV